MSLLERCARLPLAVEGVQVETLRRPAAAGGVRRTALVRLRGGGREGYGEEVTFQEGDLLASAPEVDLFFGVESLGDLWARLDQVDLFEREPAHAVVRSYRRWAFEAAALDLALRQAGLSLGDALGRSPRPLRFVVSPPAAFFRRFPGSRLKIDAVDLQPGLPVDIVDFKRVGDEALVERVHALYPEALLEDPPALADRVRASWDVGIRSASDLARLESRPAAVNVKPARLGSVRVLFDLYAFCALEGIAVYGGGQHELGPGRAQVQLLAALFHPDAPNDVAPVGYNDIVPPAGLARSPLRVPERPGFG